MSGLRMKRGANVKQLCLDNDDNHSDNDDNIDNDDDNKNYSDNNNENDSIKITIKIIMRYW